MGAQPHRQSRHRGAGLRLFLRRGEVPTSGNRQMIQSPRMGEPEALRIPEQHWPDAHTKQREIQDTTSTKTCSSSPSPLVRTIFTAGR